MRAVYTALQKPAFPRVWLYLPATCVQVVVTVGGGEKEGQRLQCTGDGVSAPNLTSLRSTVSWYGALS